MKLIIREAAQNDLTQAYAWYEDRREGLGLEFVDAVELCIEGIMRQPLAHQVVLEMPEPLRRGLVPRFPYGVLYHARPDAVVVIYIFHGKLNPARIHSRFGKLD